jgi:hypothetical protein
MAEKVWESWLINMMKTEIYIKLTSLWMKMKIISRSRSRDFWLTSQDNGDVSQRSIVC